MSKNDSAGFTHRVLGRTGIEVCRLGLSASHWPGRKTVQTAIDRGVNLFFAYGFDRQMIGTLREEFRGKRERLVLMTGAYNFIWAQQNLQALERGPLSPEEDAWMREYGDAVYRRNRWFM